jgi:hypothetical protein
MSHHLSGPNLRSPAEDARLDLTDVFAFAAPSGDRCVLIMNANPTSAVRPTPFTLMLPESPGSGG